MTRTIAVVSGRVQNVGFRYNVMRIARRYDVAGTVRNVRDGARLEIDVEGEAAAVEAFLDDILAHPPSGARVDGVERSAAEPRGLRTFTAAETA